MKEQSHKREMSAAVRGDFARLRRRGVVSTLAVSDGDEPERVAEEAQAAPVAEPDPAAIEPGAGGDGAGGSRLRRLLGRR